MFPVVVSIRLLRFPVDASKVVLIFPVAVTVAGTSGKMMSMAHTHNFGSNSAHTHTVSSHTHTHDQAASWNYASGGSGIGIMYAVVYNSGKNTTGLNAHFSQNHVSHP